MTVKRRVIKNIKGRQKSFALCPNKPCYDCFYCGGSITLFKINAS